MRFNARPHPRNKLAALPVAALLVCVAVLLAACNDDNAPSADGAEAAIADGAEVANAGDLEALLDDVDAGQSRLTFSGAVTSTGDYTTGEAGRYAGDSADVFQPARGGRGDHARRGSNADGPYMLSIYTDAVHQDDQDDVVRAWITVVLPEEAGPGTYPMAAPRDAEDDEAQASLAGDGYGWQFARKIEGTLHIAELGEKLTAAWDFVASDRAGKTVNVSGGVKELAFTPQQEAEFLLLANGDTVEHFGRLTSQRKSNGRHTLLLGPGVYLELPPDADAGTYPIRKRRLDDGDVTVTLSDYNFDEAEGELTLEREGGYFRGNYTVTTAGEDDVELSGSFDRVSLTDS